MTTSMTTTPLAGASDELQEPGFIWTIKDFSLFDTRKLYSEVFLVGGHKWRMLIFPRGNNFNQLSLYLGVADSATMIPGWNIYANFSLAILDGTSSTALIEKGTDHKFNERDRDCGFKNFIHLYKLSDYIFHGALVVRLVIAVHSIYDSEKETNFVGLKNHGLTCYTNSLLQTLYHIPYFTKFVYQISKTEDESFPLVLQALFYKLRYGESSVDPIDLTTYFGHKTRGFSLPYLQELKHTLFQNLEDTLKGTCNEGTILKMFEGHHICVIRSNDFEVKSISKESFCGLQLDVKGSKDVHASFDKYVEFETLKGDNKIIANKHGLQDAKKGVSFIDFPPVLQLHLKRFEYDVLRDTMVKINDSYEFPLELDLDRENGKYLSPDADRSVRNLYMLHSVLVHSSEVHGGDYAFIRPKLTNQWYKFDDEKVTKDDMKWALVEQDGGEEETKYSSSDAYMLVYIRVSDKDKILCDVNENDIAEHVRVDEDKRRCKAQPHLYTIIKVARDEDMKEQVGNNIFFDLVDHDKVSKFEVQKNMPFSQFKEEVARSFGIAAHLQRFWIWRKRLNLTYRVERPLTPEEETQTVGELTQVYDKDHNAELKLFLEVKQGQDLRLVPPLEKTEDGILLFFKLYDSDNRKLRYVGNLLVDKFKNPLTYEKKLNEMVGYDLEEELIFFEEIKFEPTVMCERVIESVTFRHSQLSDGDIICIAKMNVNVDAGTSDYRDVSHFLDDVKKSQVTIYQSVVFQQLPGGGPKTVLRLRKNATYDEVVDALLGGLRTADKSIDKIRLTAHNSCTQEPMPSPIEEGSVNHLMDMLFLHISGKLFHSDILYYEKLKTQEGASKKRAYGASSDVHKIAKKRRKE